MKIGGKKWRDASINQGVSRIVCNHQKLGRVKEGIFFEVFGENTALPTHLFQALLAFTIIGKQISGFFSHAVCGNLLKKP